MRCDGWLVIMESTFICSNLRLQNLTIGYSVVANGLLVESTHFGQKVELQVKAIEILGECDGKVSILLFFPFLSLPLS